MTDYSGVYAVCQCNVMLKPSNFFLFDVSAVNCFYYEPRIHGKSRAGFTLAVSDTIDGNGNGLLFHMTQPTSRSTVKAIACSKPTISEHQSK